MVKRLTDEWLMVGLIGFTVLMVILSLFVERHPV